MSHRQTAGGENPTSEGVHIVRFASSHQVRRHRDRHGTASDLPRLPRAGTASALTSPHDDFLAAISDEGIGYDSPTGGHLQRASTCVSAIDDGADPLDLGDEMLSNTDLTLHQAAVFVVESVFNYCPAHEDLLP